MKIAIHIRKVFFKSRCHIKGIVLTGDFPFNTSLAVEEVHSFFRPQNKNDRRKHITQHTGVWHTAIDDDRVAHDTGTRRPSRTGIENMMVAYTILDEIPFVIP